MRKVVSMQYSNHQPVKINNLTIEFGSKELITNPFNYNIYSGERIAIIGRNGCGKSILLKALCGINQCFDGDIVLPEDVSLGYVPQVLNDKEIKLSGGQMFNHYLSQALLKDPNLLLLDEPTNHLDNKNRSSLFGLLSRYRGTLIVITHDTELLNYVDTIWHVANGKINVFNGSYQEYLITQQQEWNTLTNSVRKANQDKKLAHELLMNEQQRYSKSIQKGKQSIAQNKWSRIAAGSKSSQAEVVSGRRNIKIQQSRQKALDKLQDLYVPEVIIPKFNLTSANINSKTILEIENGSIAYSSNGSNILTGINLQLNGVEKVVLQGNNGSGKSTLVKAILNHSSILRTGKWTTPEPNDIGYVDQHYSNLDSELTAVELLQNIVPAWSYAEIRNHLNVFLLRKNEEVHLATKYLSGGEKARLSLALIAANPPKLLILDEITNNIDLEAKKHLQQILQAYPSCFILICHDADFVASLLIDKFYLIEDGGLKC